MMLTHRKDLNILDNNHLIVILMEHSSIHNIPQVLLIPFREEHHGLGVALGRLEEALAVGIFADAFEDRADGAGEFLETCFGFGGGGFEAGAGAGAWGTLLVVMGTRGEGGRTGPAETVEVDCWVLCEGTFRPTDRGRVDQSLIPRISCMRFINCAPRLLPRTV
jgi:hypothetical protein